MKPAPTIAFGRPFISSPDLPERFAHRWLLAPEAEMSVWFAFGPKGHADFPAYREAAST